MFPTFACTCVLNYPKDVCEVCVDDYLESIECPNCSGEGTIQPDECPHNLEEE